MLVGVVKGKIDRGRRGEGGMGGEEAEVVEGDVLQIVMCGESLERKEGGGR